MKITFLVDHERQELRSLGRLPITLGSHREPALADLQQVIKLLPNRSHPFFGTRLADRGQNQALREAVETLALRPPGTAAGWHVCGEAWTWLGEHGRALAAYERALLLEPARPNSLFDLWWLQYWEDRHEEALATAERLEQILPAEPEVHVMLARALEEVERGDDALREYSVALDLCPDYWHAHLGIAWIRHRCGRNQEALFSAQRAAQLQPKSPFAHYLQAQVHTALGQEGDALRCLERCLEHQPDNQEALRDRAVLLHGMGRVEEALGAVEQALDRGQELTELLYLQAILQRELGRPELAAQSLDTALLVDGDRAELASQARRGGAGNLGQHEDARRCLHEAVRLAPSDPSAHFHLGETLSCMGRHAEAARAFRRASAFDPHFAAARYAAGVCCTQSWDLEAAFEWLDEAFELDNGLLASAEKDPDLELLRTPSRACQTLSRAARKPSLRLIGADCRAGKLQRARDRLSLLTAHG